MNFKKIFIGGAGRSGTTILCLMLNAHPSIVMGTELPFWRPHNLKNELSKFFKNGMKCDEDSFVFNFIKGINSLGITNAELNNIIKGYKKDICTLKEACAFLEKIFSYIVKKRSVTHVGVKILRDLEDMVLFERYLKPCYFIHIIRDVRDILTSQNRQDITTTNMRVRLSNWINFIENIKYKYKSNDNYLEIRYEDLIYDTENVLKNICNFVELKFDKSMINYHSYPHAFYRHCDFHLSYEDSKKPIHKKSIGQYKKNFNKLEIDYINEKAGPLLNNLGYDI